MKTIIIILMLVFLYNSSLYTLKSNDLAMNSFRTVRTNDGNTTGVPFFYTDKVDIKIWLDSHGIENYTINNNGTVNVDGTVKIAFIDDEFIPVKFWVVRGDFIVYGNNNLSNLYFAPIKCYTLVIMDCPNITTPKGLSQPDSYDKIMCDWDIFIKGDMNRTVNYWNYYVAKYPETYKAEMDYINKLIKYITAKNELEYLKSLRK